MRPPLRGVVFDLDGVLVHTDELHYQAWSQVAGRLGITFTREANHALRGVSRRESLERLLTDAAVVVSESEKEVLLEEKNTIYRALLADLGPDDVDPAVRDLLRQLRERGLRLAIGSSSRNARLILARVRLRDSFDAVSDGENITRSKPDPEVFLRAADFLAPDPGECAVVEDARAGVAAAVAGGFVCFGVGDAALDPATTWPLDTLPQILDHLPGLGRSDRSARGTPAPA